MSIAGGFDRAIERGVKAGCDTVQVFLKNNMQWRAKPIGKREAATFADARDAARIAPVFAHSSYLINLCAINPKFLRQSIDALTDEIRRADMLGVPFIVMHPGSHMGAGEPTGLRAVVNSLDTVFDRTAGSPVQIALETTAGQGSNLGYRFEHLADIIRHVQQPARLAVCVDTCHIFAAGYDLRTPSAYRKTMKELARTVGLERVVAFHVNDSKTPLGSRRDRHEHIGKGQIGLAGFRQVVRDKRWTHIPMVLETPKSDDLHEDIENLAVLRGLMT
jgi:deoxyribonuclease-4